jgi:FkbM family methyltransferase
MDVIRVARQFLHTIGLRRQAHALIDVYARLRPRKICTRRGITYDLDMGEAIDRAIWLGGWEPETISFLCRNIRQDYVVIEVGANIGAHTLIIADLVGKTGKVYAFEPTKFALQKLHANIALNPAFISRIVVRSEMVSNHEGAMPSLNIRSSFRVHATGQEESVPAHSVALDNLGLTRVDAIKIDVDGYDYKVLQGAEGLIKQFRPLVFVELCEYTLNAQGDSIRDIFRLMSALGYSGTHENGTPIKSEDALGLVGDHTSINAVFMHNVGTSAPV